MEEEIRLDIPFRKSEEEARRVGEVYYSDFGTIMNGNTTGEEYQKNFLSIERPLLATEVFSKLRRKGWGKFDGRFMTESEVVSSQRLMYRVYIPYKYGNQVSDVDYPENNIDVIDTGYRSISSVKIDDSGEKTYESEVKIDPFFQMWPEKFNFNPNQNEAARKNIKSQVDELYKEIFGDDISGINTISFHKSTRDVINTQGRSVSFDLISSDSDMYTNSVDLSELRDYSVSSGISARIDVTVQYSTYSNEETKIFNRDVTFSAFRYEYDEESNTIECISEPFLGDLNNDVIVSYTTETGILEVVPKAPRVSECIISRCTITYGEF